MNSTDSRVLLHLTLDPTIARQLHEACGDVESIGAYLDNVILLRTRAWQRALAQLEAHGWLHDDVLTAHERMDQVLFLEFCSARDLRHELRAVGLQHLARRLSLRPTLTDAFREVMIELRAGNQACARNVKLMRMGRPSWWRRLRQWRLRSW